MAKKIRTFEERMHIIEEVEKNPFEKKVQIAKRLNLPLSTLNSIISRKDEIRKQADKYGNCAKKSKTGREAMFKDMEKMLYDWYCQARFSQIPIDGIVLRKKALEIADLKGIKNFTASNGWISRFKDRHNLKYKKMCVEREAVNDRIFQDWILKLPLLTEGYDPRDIYCAVETVLFYQCLSDCTSALKGEVCDGESFSKERLTVLLCSNSDGSDKRKPVVTGKSANPKCFKNIKNLPVSYHANLRAWMTNEVFSQFLQDFDNSIGEQNKKVILFVDNCMAHLPDMHSLKNVKVIFYPTNCTNGVRPFYLDIIHSFKCHYREILVEKAVTEEGEINNIKIDLLQAAHFIVSAWDRVTPETMQNCLKKSEGNVMELRNDTPADNNEGEENNFLLFGEKSLNITFQDYATIGENVWTLDLILIDEKVVQKEEIDDEAEYINPELVPTFSDGFKGLETI